MVWDDPSWPMMSDYPPRLRSLQKCNYIQIMVFPVVVIDKTDAGKKWLVEHWMIYTRGRRKNEASQSQLSVSSAVLSCTFFSGQHWLPSNTPWSTIPQSSAPTARGSPRPLQYLPAFLPPWIPSPSAPPPFINRKDHWEGCSLLFVLNYPKHATFPLNLDFCFTFLPFISSLFKRFF